MNGRQIAAVAASFVLVVGGAAVSAASSEAAPPAAAEPRLVMPAAKHFSNCTSLHRKYPHGVGKKGARDKVSGRAHPVTNFTRNNAVYASNRSLDRDHDGVACEKR